MEFHLHKCLVLIVHSSALRHGDHLNLFVCKQCSSLFSSVLLSSLGYGLPDDIVIEKKGKGDTFVDCTGMDVKISSIKFIQHDSVEGILSKYLDVGCIICFEL